MSLSAPLNRQENSALVAALVPAYNEAGRINTVLQALGQVKIIDEIIVINDGSSDATEADAHQAAGNDPRLIIFRHKKNLGKGQALFTGCSASQAKYIVMLDADLIGLKPAHIENLISPVISGDSEMAIGVFKHGNCRADAAQWLCYFDSSTSFLTSIPLAG